MTNPETTFEDALAQLHDEESEMSREILAFFSDMTPSQLSTLQSDWGKLSPTRKQEFVSGLKRVLEFNTLLSFDSLARVLLKDDDAFVRTDAIRLLSEYEDEDIVPDFLALAQNDPAVVARAEAITALGAFILRGELDEIAEKRQQNIEDTLIALVSANEKTELRQRALESLGYSSRPEVAKLIREAWQRNLPMWQASAVFAMGRSCDQGWRDEVLQALLHENDVVRLSATKAAGELELGDARPLLLKMLEDERDEDVFRALIWSLSQIGGDDVREYLLSLLDQYDDDEVDAIEYIEEALANLDFTEDLQDFDFLSFDEDAPLAN
jgi:HEAT repeat protein